ncbi:MAG: Bax inhibitor-1/YccA family protein [Actinomycetota bacterium]|nr:Bax inhibitor-1/YccA family protein [Actinomycetota bacterium]
MRSSNPALNDRIFEKEIQSSRGDTAVAEKPGWAAPGVGVPPAPDTVSPWAPAGPVGPPPGSVRADAALMRRGGVVTATSVLLIVLVVAGWFGWNAVKVVTGTDAAGNEIGRSTSMPPWIIGALIAGLVLAIVTILKPKIARFTAVLYAIAEGLLLGAISHLYEVQFKGIALQAVGLTIGVFAIMLFLYATRIIKVTDRLRTGIIAATGAVFLVYMASILLRVFGADVPFIHDAGPIGILFSVVVVGIAAFNLLLDFDFIDRGVAAGAPRYMEWYAAFGLLVTLVWLYLELLRLLSKLRSR